MKHTTRILFYTGLALMFVVGVMASSQAHTAQQTISAVGVPVLQGDLRTSINAELIKANANFGEIYTALNGSPWLVQTTAPSIHNVFWITIIRADSATPLPMDLQPASATATSPYPEINLLAQVLLCLGRI